jgi:hypothetical protein
MLHALTDGKLADADTIGTMKARKVYRWILAGVKRRQVMDRELAKQREESEHGN